MAKNEETIQMEEAVYRAEALFRTIEEKIDGLEGTGLPADVMTNLSDIRSLAECGQTELSKARKVF